MPLFHFGIQGFDRASVAMDEQQQKEFISEHMDSDLQFVLSDNGVSLGAQVAVARRYGTLRKFRALGDSRAEIRQACLQDFAIPQDNPLTVQKQQRLSLLGRLPRSSLPKRQKSVQKRRS